MKERFFVQGVEFHRFERAVERAQSLVFTSPGPVEIEIEAGGIRQPLCQVEGWKGADVLSQAEAMVAREAAGKSEFFIL